MRRRWVVVCTVVVSAVVELVIGVVTVGSGAGSRRLLFLLSNDLA